MQWIKVLAIGLDWAIACLLNQKSKIAHIKRNSCAKNSMIVFDCRFLISFPLLTSLFVSYPPLHELFCSFPTPPVTFLKVRLYSRSDKSPVSPKKNIYCDHLSKFQFDLDYCQALYHEPLARVIAQALAVFDIKFTFTFTLTKCPTIMLNRPRSLYCYSPLRLHKKCNIFP